MDNIEIIERNLREKFKTLSKEELINIIIDLYLSKYINNIHDLKMQDQQMQINSIIYNSTISNV